MKISIITVVKNNEKFIRDCIESVFRQDYPDIEYILIDGNSSDSTLKIINEYQSKIHKLISENDEGPYYAMNKGISMASGEIIGFLNADDFYIHPHVISEVVDTFRKNQCDSIYADLYYVSRKNTG